MKEEKVEFYNEKNQKLVGLLTLPENKKPPIVIIIHGFKGTKEYHTFANNSIKPLTDAGFAVLRIDCRGSGDSDLQFKDMTIKSESEDILTTIDYVKKLETINSNKIALIGISMGASAILMAMKNMTDVKTLIFWALPCILTVTYVMTLLKIEKLSKKKKFFMLGKVSIQERYW
jgi:hypothetical protein